MINKCRKLTCHFHKLFINTTTSPILKEMGIAGHLTCLLRNLQVNKQQLELVMEPQTGSNSGKEHVKAVCCHPACLSYMQSTSCETLSWMKNKLEPRLQAEISISSDMQMTPLLWQKVRRTKEPPDESERGE